VARDIDSEVDLVVLGLGAAGAAAAVAAADAGLEVLVVEKQAADAHTPGVRLSGGKIMVARDAAAATDYLDYCADGMVPRDVSAAWAAGATSLEDWLTDVVGLPVAEVDHAEHPEAPGAESVLAVCAARDGQPLPRDEGRGPALYDALRAAVRARDVPVWWNAPATGLLHDPAGVHGVEVQHDGRLRRIRARRGVVLSTGGFEFDDAAKAAHLPVEPVHFYGNPGNEGDGLRLAGSVGADTWHLDQFVGRGVASFPLDGGRLNVMLFIGPPPYVILDQQGRRFADESAQAALRHDFYHHLLQRDPATGQRLRVPAFWLFDEARRRAGPITNNALGLPSVGVHRFSDDHRREQQLGWIHSGATVAEAAAAAGVADPEQAERSVAEFNRACERGTDELGRPPETLVPLVEPPYHCIEIWPGGSHTTGGPRRDARARVVGRDGDPIRGLYGAGELGAATGRRYPAPGSSLSDALCFGRLAAADAAGVADEAAAASAR